MNRKRVQFAVTLGFALLFSVKSAVLAAPVTGNGTSTFVSVFSGATTITGFSDFVFVDSTRRLGILTSSPLSTVSIAGDPPQSSTSTLVLFGTNFIVGGSASGTYLGANPPTFNGDFVNFQVASSSKFKVASSGSLTATDLTVTGLNYGVMVASGTTQVATIAPGASGNVLTSNGSVWASAAPSASNVISQFIFGEDVGAGKAVYMSDGTNAKAFQVDTGGTLTTSLVSYYKLEDATDFSDNAKDLTNGGSVTFVSAKVNNGGNFVSASSQLLYRNNTSDFDNDGSAAMSWAGWIKSSSTNAEIVSKRPNAGNYAGYDVTFYGAGGTISFVIQASDSNRIIVHGSTAVNDNTWRHVAVVYDGSKVASNVKIYVNGSLDTTNVDANTFSGSSSNTNKLTMSGYDGAGADYNGLKDEWGIWNKTLSAAEVSDLYNGGAGQTMITKNNGLAGRVYAASATDNVYADGFIGFSAATTSVGNSGDVIIAGLAKDLFTNLSVGKRYYLGNASGTVSTAPGSVTRKVGIAVTTTTLEITNIW